MKKRTLAGFALVLTFVVLFAAAAGAGAWLFYTGSGLQWLSARLSGYAGEGLTLEGVAGTLAGGARIEHIRYAGADIEVNVRRARLSVSPWSVLRLKPTIRGLAAAELAITTKPGEPRGTPPDTLVLPVDFEVSDAHVQHLNVNLGKELVEITNVRFSYSGGKSEHQVDLNLAAMELAVSLRGTIAAQPPFVLSASFSVAKPHDPTASVSGSAGGNLSEITVTGEAQSGEARVAATAVVHPYGTLPLAGLTAQISALDLQAWDASLPRTGIAGTIKLDRAGELLVGPVELSNTIPGPYDRNRVPLARLKASVETDLKRLGFTALAADLGAAGAIAGSGKLHASAAELTLRTQNLNLAAIHTRLRATQLAGRADIVLEDARQRIVADLKERDLALSLSATRSGDAIAISKFEASARGGVARGEAQLSTAEPQPFSIAANFARFDPAAWGDFPQGSLNGELAAKGTVSGPAADVRFALRDSRWLAAPLAGQGTLSVTSERLRNADIALTLGGNQFAARGALGGSGDKLSVRFDAPRLALIDKALSGRLRGTAQVSGEFKSPRVSFDASGAGLSHERYGAIKSLEASGAIGMQAGDPLNLALRASNISAPQGELAAATVRIDGTRSAHSALVEARGERIDFHARAQGGWHEGRGWSGTVQELVNRGEVPIELVAPVATAISRDAVRVEPLTLRAMNGELTVRELAYGQGRLTTAGSFSALPVKPIVALAGGPADLAGTLQLSGRWALRSTPRLLGSVTITRQSGDITLGPKSPVRVGLETLAIEAQFGERGLELDARLRSALATASARGTLAADAGAIEGTGYTAASPIDFSAEADIAQLQPFAAFIDTPMLVRGEAQARLRGTGTLGDPQITGTISADNLALALPAEGIDLTGGTLRAVLTAREVRVESFSIRGGEGTLTAHGTLARIGFDQASLEWQAERFRVLARPDQRLIVSGKGNAALKDGKVSFAGKLRADEGLFEIGETRLPRLGSDVVIIGRKPPLAQQQQAAKLPDGVSVDLTVNLGNQVLVRGQGLQVWLSGDISVYTNARGDILGSGTINARNGTFVAYGQRLDIERGNFYFNGPISNPALDIVALRKRLAVEAGVAISGTLQNPIVRVVSEPPLPESEAMSWLILGRGPDQATAGELSALPLAAGALLGKATGSIAKQIGVDELGIQGGGVEGQFLTVAKRINDRLYVYFEQSLGGAQSLLRLEMTLTRRVVLTLQAGQPSAVGVLYRYRWD